MLGKLVDGLSLRVVEYVSGSYTGSGSRPVLEFWRMYTPCLVRLIDDKASSSPRFSASSSSSWKVLWFRSLSDS